MRPLHVRLTADRHGAPLLEVEGLPGDGAALRPEQLRHLAAALLAAAAAAERRHTMHRGRPLPPEVRLYPVTPEAPRPAG